MQRTSARMTDIRFPFISGAVPPSFPPVPRSLRSFSFSSSFLSDFSLACARLMPVSCPTPSPTRFPFPRKPSPS